MTFIDNFLNKITMYRLVLYCIIVIVGAAVLFELVGILSNNPVELIFSVLVILGTCWLVNTVFAWIFSVDTNVESIYITVLILALIVTPVAATDYAGTGFLVFVSAVAMASKYIFAIGRKHIFNPAALGVALGALALGLSAGWWVGTAALMPFVLLGGLAVVRKIRHLDLVAGYFLVGFASIAVMYGPSVGDVGSALWRMLLHSSLLFFVFVILTEPLTPPP